MSEINWKPYANALMQVSSTREIDGKINKVQRGARYLSLGVILRNPNDVKKALRLDTELATATNTKAVVIRRSGSIVYYQFQLSKDYWRQYTSQDLTISPGHAPVGFSDGKDLIEVTFKPAHIGVYGTTGAGKSITVQRMIVSLAKAYNPEQLQILLIDPKGDHDNFVNLAHSDGWPIARIDSDFDKVLSYIGQEILKRDAIGATEAQKMRRIVLVCDEAERVISSSKDNEATLKTLVERGRGLNINGLFSTPSPHRGKFPTIHNLVNNRWCGWVDKAQTSTFIMGVPALNCNKLSMEGDFVHLEPGDNYSRLQVVMPDKEEIDDLPRAQLEAPKIEETEIDFDRLPPMPDNKTGRPSNRIEPEIEAVYHWYKMRGKEITPKLAKSTWQLTSYAHSQYKTHVNKFCKTQEEMEEMENE